MGELGAAEFEGSGIRVQANGDSAQLCFDNLVAGRTTAALQCMQAAWMSALLWFYPQNALVRVDVRSFFWGEGAFVLAVFLSGGGKRLKRMNVKCESLLNKGPPPNIIWGTRHRKPAKLCGVGLAFPKFSID